MKINKAWPMSAVLLAALAVSAAAQPQDLPGHSCGFHEGGIYEKLQLTDAQKTTIQSLFAANREHLGPVHQQLREQRALLRDAAKQRPFDEAAVRFQAQELAKLQAELLVQRAALMNQVSSVLTAEQQAKLEELREQRNERFREQRERHRHQSAGQRG